MSPVDWPDVKRRIAAVWERAERAMEPTPERARAILEERAAALARVPGDERAAGERLSAVTFALAGERHAIEARFVRQGLRADLVTPVPGAPPVLLGVTPHEGELLPVFDLARVLLGRTAPAARLLVLGADSAELAVATDEALEVVTLAAADVAPAPASLGEDARALVRGVRGDGLVLLDGAALLADGRFQVASDGVKT